MRDWWRRVFVSCLTAVILAGTVAVAFASGNDPCFLVAHTETGHAHHDHHDGKAADTQSCFICPCCLSLSALAADPLPQTQQRIDYVTYLDRTEPLIGRSIAPAIFPPRPNA